MKFWNRNKDKDKDKDKKLFCANCQLEFKTIDELADHAEKRHPYR